MWESNAIAQYLVEAYAPESFLYPRNTKARAVVNQLLQFYAGTLLQIIKSIVVPIFKGEEKTVSDSKKSQLYEALGYINEVLSRSDWLAGNNMTLADLAIYAAVSTIVSFGADVSVYKFLENWMENCKSLPGYDENLEGVNIFTSLFRELYTDKI